MSRTTECLPGEAIPRDLWGAVPPRVIDFGIVHPVPHIHLTYTGTPVCTTKEECMTRVKDIQTADMAESQSDIKPNFLIGGDGNTYVGRGWVSDPYVPDAYKDKLNNIFSIAFIGPKGSTPSEADKTLLTNIITKGQEYEFVVPNPTYHEDY